MGFIHQRILEAQRRSLPYLHSTFNRNTSRRTRTR